MANVLHAYFGLKKKEQDFKKNKEMECDNLITTVTVVHLPGSSHKYSTDDSESHFLKKKNKTHSRPHQGKSSEWRGPRG